MILISIKYCFLRSIKAHISTEMYNVLYMIEDIIDYVNLCFEDTKKEHSNVF